MIKLMDKLNAVVLSKEAFSTSWCSFTKDVRVCHWQLMSYFPSFFFFAKGQRTAQTWTLPFDALCEIIALRQLASAVRRSDRFIQIPTGWQLFRGWLWSACQTCLPPCSSTFTDAPLPLSLVWGAKRTWRNALPTTRRMRRRRKANPREESGRAT